MSWTGPADLRVQVQRLWASGELLRALEPGSGAWPLRLRLAGPTSAELTERFEAVRQWARGLAATPNLRLEWRQTRHRVHGEQRLPAQAWVDSAADALAMIGQRAGGASWLRLRQALEDRAPALLPWLRRRPLQALELAPCWDQLLAVSLWMQAHPRPAIYLREVDVPGVDSKFIESHRGVLSEWLDLLLPSEAVDTTASGAAAFARRYGFKEKPLRVRCRVLDPALRLLPGVGACPDLTLDAASFAALDLPVDTVLVTENETNFLALPSMAGAIAIFGAGYGFDALTPARWLTACRLHYWGDIDTHGFAILDQLRVHWPQARSLLMDRGTLLQHRVHWGREPQPVAHDLPRLDAAESALYDELRHHRLGESVRLEQERVGFGWARAALAAL